MLGIEIRGDTLAIQIDGEAPLFGLAARGITASQTITVGGLTAPIMALSGTAVITSVTNEGSTYTWTLVIAGDAVEYFIFDIGLGLPSPNGFGMEVRDGTGRLIYSSASQPMQIIDRVELPANDETITLSRSYGSRRLAYIPLFQQPIATDHYFTTSAFGVGYYDENVTEYIHAPSTPRSDQSSTGVIEASTLSTGGSFNGEAGRGDPPAPYRSYAGAWSFWVIDVSFLN